MKYTLIKVGNVEETAEKLNGLDEFNALGLPYPAKVFNNWEAGAPKDEYPELVLELPNYTEEELSNSPELQLEALFGNIDTGMNAVEGDTLIIVDFEDPEVNNAILVADSDKEICGYAGTGDGGKVINYNPRTNTLVNKVIEEIVAKEPELTGYVSIMK